MTRVIRWDVTDGDILGALIQCDATPACRVGRGCDGTGVLFRPYQLPSGAFIDLYRDADLLLRVLDRESTASVPTEGDER